LLGRLFALVTIKELNRRDIAANRKSAWPIGWSRRGRRAFGERHGRTVEIDKLCFVLLFHGNDPSR